MWLPSLVASFSCQVPLQCLLACSFTWLCFMAGPQREGAASPSLSCAGSGMCWLQLAHCQGQDLTCHWSCSHAGAALPSAHLPPSDPTRPPRPELRFGSLPLRQLRPRLQAAVVLPCI